MKTLCDYCSTNSPTTKIKSLEFHGIFKNSNDNPKVGNDGDEDIIMNGLLILLRLLFDINNPEFIENIIKSNNGLEINLIKVLWNECLYPLVDQPKDFCDLDVLNAYPKSKL